MSRMTEWAENEIKYACERERKASGTPEEEWDYGCACYESALKAFKSLSEDGHSGMSIGFTKNILVRLIDGKPLTPIEDIEEIWNECHGLRDDVKSTYQCKRMSSLFKDVYEDGSVKYNDNGRVVCIDIGSGSAYSNGFIRNVIDEMYPITMPYMPATAPYKVYMEDSLYDENNGDFDTMGLLYLINPDGERIELNKFYKESVHSFVEISKEEYDRRKKLAELKGGGGDEEEN